MKKNYMEIAVARSQVNDILIYILGKFKLPDIAKNLIVIAVSNLDDIDILELREKIKEVMK